MSTVNDNTSNNKIDIVTNSEANVTVTQPSTTVIEVVASGPSGKQGPQGIQGEPGSAQDLTAIQEFTASAQSNLDTLNTFTSSVVLTSGTSSMSVATASFALFAVSASVEIQKEVSSSFADVAGGLTLRPSIHVTNITGSVFSGSFVGDGSSLTNVTAIGTLSSSAQIATEISGAFGATSASFSTRTTALESNPVFSASSISGSSNTLSASFSTRVTTNELITAKTLLSGSLQIASNISGSFIATSSSLASRISEIQLFPFTGDAQITGSLDISGSLLVSPLPGDIDNLVIGSSAGSSIIDGALYNTLIGKDAGAGITNRDNNVIIGTSAGFSNDGEKNVFVGVSAGYYGNAAHSNIGIGYSALKGDASPENISDYNIGIGENAGFQISTGNNNIALGYQSLYGHSSGIDGAENIGLGRTTLFYLRDGEYNIALGREAGYYQTDGDHNIYLGYKAGYNNSTGNNNILIGESAGSTLTNPNKQLIIGSGSTPLISGSLDGGIMIQGQVSASSYIGDGSGLSGISTSLPIKNFANATQFTVTDTTGLLFESIGNITVGFNSGTKKITYTVPSNLLSGSAQIASNISGSFTAPSASFSTRVTTLESGGGSSGIFTDSNGFKVTDNNLIISSSGTKQLSSSLSVQGSGSGIFEVKGATGQLFEVQDGLDGVLMSVNDISGIPILTVSSSGNIIIPNAGRLIGTASVALSVPGATTAFPFTGNALITGDLDITGSGSDIFKVRSKSGSLFSVDDGLDGILMSVNDISGLPLFEVSSSGDVEIVTGNISGSAISTASFGHIINNGLNFDTAVSKSAQAAGFGSGGGGSSFSAATISGSFGAPSASFSTRVSFLEGGGAVGFTAAGISGSFGAPSASFSTRITTNTSNITTNTSNISSNLTKINSLTAATASLVAETLSIFRQEGSPIPGTGTTHSIAVKVAGVNGANKYLLADVVTGSVVMNQGDAYKFDQSDSSNGSGGSHPFRFSTGENGSGTAPYEVGVTVAGSPGSAGAYTLISVTAATTAPLYYYCTNHGNMGLGGILSIDSGSLISTGFAKITGSLIVSSSNVDFLLATGVSGSFSGSFEGDGSGLTGINASNVVGNFTSAGISGSFNASSGSFSTRVTTLEAAGGSSGTSTMIASGSTSASADPATGVVINHSGSTAFSVIGSEGTLFSIDDELDGTLFTVNDRSGIPMFEVSSSGRIVADEGEAIIRSQRPIVTIGTNPFTASLNNVGQYFRVGGNVTCSIKVNATASCPIGAEFDLFQTSSVGNLLFEADPGVTINSKNSNLNLAGQFSSATLKCIDTDEWDLMGDLT